MQRKIIIRFDFLGAAGLYCGILLAQAGHRVTIYEASNRAGGRIFTYRDPQNPSLYMGELGAMRFLLDIQPYVNTLIRQRYKLNTIEFVNSISNAYVYLNGIRATIREVQENPDIFKFNTTKNERGKVKFVFISNK
jgi:monoamine oxidase